MQDVTDSSTSSEHKQHNALAPRRYLRLNHLQKSLHNWRGQLLLYFALLAIVFAGMGFLQHLFVHRQVEQTVDQELASWAAKISTEIAYKDKWDLQGYHNANIPVSNYFVVAQDGLIIDVEGIIGGDLLSRVFNHVEISNLIYNSPQTILSSIGEKWRLLGKKVDGGVVIVGISAQQNIKEAEADKQLTESIAKFGSTLEKAMATRSRAIDIAVDYAVLSAAGELKSAYSSIPLKATSEFAGKKLTKTIHLGDKWYRVYSEPILDKNNKSVGTIIVPKDMTLEQQALNHQDRFNIILVVVTLALTIGLTIVFTARELFRRHNSLSVEEALKIGESKTIEFKSTYRWDVKKAQKNDELRLAVLKSIAGFLNTDGGTLYIGIEEDTYGRPSLRGIEEDLKLSHHSRDKLQLHLRDLITNQIGSEFAPFITERFEEVQNKLCLIVAVDRSPEPAFVHWPPKGNSEPRFYVREGPKTSALDNACTWRYIKSRWVSSTSRKQHFPKGF